MENTIFEKIEQIVESAKTDVQKFYENGNNAAGTRVRKYMQELKKLAQELRIDVQDTKNTKVVE